MAEIKNHYNSLTIKLFSMKTALFEKYSDPPPHTISAAPLDQFCNSRSLSKSKLEL